MTERRTRAQTELIERTSPRTLFAELVGDVLEIVGVSPSPMAVAYLIELLDERVRVVEPAPAEVDQTLAEALLNARHKAGAARIQHLRDLGDRALFVSGFFGDSLRRSVVDLQYYGAIGRSAYGGVAATLSAGATEPSWPQLFEELADCFGDFADVLAEVSDRAGVGRCEQLLRIYERYLETGSARDGRRLLRRGQAIPSHTGRRFWQ